MALVLGVSIGDVVDIAANWVAVLSADNCDSAVLINNDGHKIAICSDHMTEMAPDVWVGLGLKAATAKLRLLVNAPRHMSISRRYS